MFAVGSVVAEHAVDDHGELTGGGGDGLGLPDASGEAAAESPEGVLTPRATRGGYAEGFGVPVDVGVGGRTDELAAGKREEGRADVEVGLFPAGFFGPRPDGEFTVGFRALGPEGADENFDLLVTGSDLVVVDVLELDGLAQREDKFRSVVAGE